MGGEEVGNFQEGPNFKMTRGTLGARGLCGFSALQLLGSMSTVPRDSQELSDLQALEFEESTAKTTYPGKGLLDGDGGDCGES